MKHRDTAQLTTVPFGLVFVEFGVDRLKEGAHKRNFHSWTDNATFQVEVSNWIWRPLLVIEVHNGCDLNATREKKKKKKGRGEDTRYSH